MQTKKLLVATLFCLLASIALSKRGSRFTQNSYSIDPNRFGGQCQASGSVVRDVSSLVSQIKVDLDNKLQYGRLRAQSQAFIKKFNNFIELTYKLSDTNFKNNMIIFTTGVRQGLEDSNNRIGRSLGSLSSLRGNQSLPSILSNHIYDVSTIRWKLDQNLTQFSNQNYYYYGSYNSLFLEKGKKLLYSLISDYNKAVNEVFLNLIRISIRDYNLRKALCNKNSKSVDTTFQNFAQSLDSYLQQNPKPSFRSGNFLREIVQMNPFKEMTNSYVKAINDLTNNLKANGEGNINKEFNDSLDALKDDKEWELFDLIGKIGQSFSTNVETNTYWGKYEAMEFYQAESNKFINTIGHYLDFINQPLFS